MPRIADKYFKPTTRDKKKRQTSFEHELAWAMEKFNNEHIKPYDYGTGMDDTFDPPFEEES